MTLPSVIIKHRQDSRWRGQEGNCTAPLHSSLFLLIKSTPQRRHMVLRVMFPCVVVHSLVYRNRRLRTPHRATLEYLAASRRQRGVLKDPNCSQGERIAATRAELRLKARSPGFVWRSDAPPQLMLGLTVATSGLPPFTHCTSSLGTARRWCRLAPSARPMAKPRTSRFNWAQKFTLIYVEILLQKKF